MHSTLVSRSVEPFASFCSVALFCSGLDDPLSCAPFQREAPQWCSGHSLKVAFVTFALACLSSCVPSFEWISQPVATGPVGWVWGVSHCCHTPCLEAWSLWQWETASHPSHRGQYISKRMGLSWACLEAPVAFRWCTGGGFIAIPIILGSGIRSKGLKISCLRPSIIGKRALSLCPFCLKAVSQP